MAYVLNGKDLTSVFGVTIVKDNGSRESSDSFMAWPSRKDSLTVDRQDQNGLEIDLSDPKVASREFVLKCILIASDREDYFTKYDALRTELLGADTHQVYISDHDRTYNVYYKRQSDFRSLSNINNDGVWATFTVVLGETNPNENMEFVYLVDDQDRYLIA